MNDLPLRRVATARRPAAASVLGAVASAILLLTMVVVPTAATTQSMVPACAGINIRAGTSTTSTIRIRLGLAHTVTVAGSVAGSRWSTTCPTSKSGASWYVVTAIDGVAVKTTFGTPTLYAATGVLTLATPAPAGTTGPAASAPPSSATAPPVPSPSAPPAPSPASSPVRTLAPACAGVNIRGGPATSATILTRLAGAAFVTVAGSVAGGSWSTTCPTAKAGSTWYVVTAINGSPISRLFGVANAFAATGVLAQGPTTASPMTGTVALGAATTFYGRGFGHGVGMSQYGARGRAIEGQTADQILAHYYPATTIGTVAPGLPVRVLVLAGFVPTAAAPMTIVGNAGDWTIDGVARTFPAGSRLAIAPPAAGATTWSLTVTSAAGVVLASADAAAAGVVRGTTAATTFELASKASVDDTYRGTLHWLLSGGAAAVVNEVPLETYLRGVVPAEMPATWPLQARLAQTIAARSFAAYHLHPGTGAFDVYDDTRSQVYGGVLRETAASDAAIAATANEVLRNGTALVNALFHSTAGGATENNENVFTSPTGAIVAGPVGYLRGSPDRDAHGVAYDVVGGAPYAIWQTATYTIDQLSAIFGADPRTAVGTLTALDLSNRGVSGRLISVTLVGADGSRTVSGQVFVDVFDANRPPTDAPMRDTLLSLAPIR